MKQENINYFMVGSLVIAMLMFLFFVLMRLSGPSGDTETYQVIYSDIAGIKEGTAVTFGGYTIGQVTGIAPVRDNGKTQFKLILAINDAWQLPTDSVARIASPGILADKTIDIAEGDSKEILKPGSVLSGQESASLFTAMDEVAYEIKDLSENSIRPMLEKFSTSIETVSQRIDNIGGELDQGIPQLIVNADRFLVELNNNVDQLSKILDSANPKRVSNIVNNIDTLSGNLLKTSAHLDQTITEFDGLIANYNSLATSNDENIKQTVVDLRKSLAIVSQNIDSIVYNLDTTSRNFNEFSRQIRMNPGVLLGGSPPKDAGEAQK
ncbi:MlaD family protein [Kaarinaea lacus]